MDEDKDFKIYVNAYLTSARSTHSLVITMFLVGSLGVMYLYYLALRSEEFRISGVMVIMTLVTVFVTGIIAAMFLVYRKYWSSKIVIDRTGMTYYGLLKKVSVKWGEIISIEVSSTWFSFLGRLAAVRTKKGTLYFPLTMKEENMTCPKLVVGLDGTKWIDIHGVEKPITPENCPLYAEIRKHLHQYGAR